MSILEYYKANFCTKSIENADFKLYVFRENLYIGYDKDANLCVFIKSSSCCTSPICQRTKLLSVECNVTLDYILEDKKEEGNIVHIVRCLSKKDKEKEIFLELVDAMIATSASDEQIMDVFNTLCNFFAEQSEPSDNELMGLYAELDAIVTFSSSLHIEKYWQSRDYMNFDFSFSDKLKLEVKATTKNFRKHHFLHEQLATNIYDIYILSYMLRVDDEGVSLFELINNVKPLLSCEPKKLLRVERVLKNVSEERLRELRYSVEYTHEKRHFYKASTIPQFIESTPEGVTHAEYDCDLENIPVVLDNDFITLVNAEIRGINDDEIA